MDAKTIIAIVLVVFIVGAAVWLNTVSYTHLDVYKRQDTCSGTRLTRDSHTSRARSAHLSG